MVDLLHDRAKVYSRMECTKTNRWTAGGKEAGDAGPDQNARMTGNAGTDTRFKRHGALQPLATQTLCSRTGSKQFWETCGS